MGLILLLVMLWTSWLPSTENFYAVWTIPTKTFFSSLKVSIFESGRLVTALFVHGNWSHWLINCSVFALLSFSIERVLGWKKITFIYLSAGIIGNWIACLTLQDKNLILLGASGAVSGLIGAWLVLFPNRNIKFIFPIGLYFQKTSLPLTWLVAIWLSIQIVLQFMPNPIFNVAWISHIVGFACGFLFTRFVK